MKNENEFDDEPIEELDEELDDEEFDCSGHFSGGVFLCGAAGSEECDFECPYRGWLGKTSKQIDREESLERGEQGMASKGRRG